MGIRIFQIIWVSYFCRFEGLSQWFKIFPTFINHILRFICLKRLHKHNDDCNDFEARFCCPKSFIDTGSSLSFSNNFMQNTSNLENNSETTSQRFETTDKPKLLIDETVFPDSIDDLRNFNK